MEVIRKHVSIDKEFLIQKYQKSEDEIVRIFLNDIKRELKIDYLREILRIIFDYMDSKNGEYLDELKCIFNCDKYEFSIDEHDYGNHFCIQFYRGEEYEYEIKVKHNNYFKPSVIRVRYDPCTFYCETIKYIDVPIKNGKVSGECSIHYGLLGQSCDVTKTFQSTYENGFLIEGDDCIFPKNLNRNILVKPAKK